MGTRQLFPQKSAKELLEEFVQSGSQEPYEEIVRRYAAMVYGVCLRVTGDKHDAEDATQAVFLSLALQAKTQREIKYIGPWLQKVAHRLALDVKKSKTRRRKREEKLAEQVRTHAGTNGFAGNGHHANGDGFFGGSGHRDPADGPGAEELKQILTEELNQLPAKYRLPLVMHYFGGLSREEMAAELGCNPSTLGVRVHRGKAMLGSRLTKRGITLSAIALAVLLEHAVRSAALQPMVFASKVAPAGGALLYAGSTSSGALAASARVMALARTALRSIAYAKLKFAVVVLLLIGSAAVTGASVVARYVDLSRLHLPVQLDISTWIQPLLRSFLPSLRADSGAQPSPGSALAEAPNGWHRQKITVDGDRQFAEPQVAVAPATPPAFPAPAVGASDPLGEPQSTPPQLNALARAVLTPPVTPQATVPLRKHPKAPVGAADDSTSDASADRGTDNPIDADSSASLYLGAGAGGGGGRPQVYTLPANSALHRQNLVVGDSSAAEFHQLGGTNRVDGALTLGRQRGSSGSYTMSGGSLSAQQEIIGDSGDGAFIQINGVNIAQQSIIIGRSDGGSGSYHQSGGSTQVVNDHPSADPGSDPGGLHLADARGSTGNYLLAGGVLMADPQVIGKAGKGALTQTGGTNITGALDLGAQPGSSGDYKLVNGKLVFTERPTNKPSATISIGGEGHGSFNLGDATSTGNIYEIGSGGSVVVRGKPSGQGSLLGWGKVNLSGGLVNNSQVIADGFNHNRVLDLSSFQWVTSSIENPRDGGTSGWFARRKGELKLPGAAITAGSDTYTWGEDQYDPMLDLVNSARLRLYGVKHDGMIQIALQSPLRDDVPRLPSGHQFIGLWKVAIDDLDGFSAADLEVRYDDALAAAKGLDQNILKLWVHTDPQGDGSRGQWIRLDHDPSFYRDTLDHIVGAHFDGTFDYFAVSAPEPGSAALLLVGGGALLLRRRRLCRRP